MPYGNRYESAAPEEKKKGQAWSDAWERVLEAKQYGAARRSREEDRIKRRAEADMREAKRAQDYNVGNYAMQGAALGSLGGLQGAGIGATIGGVLGGVRSIKNRMKNEDKGFFPALFDTVTDIDAILPGGQTVAAGAPALAANLANYRNQNRADKISSAQMDMLAALKARSQGGAGAGGGTGEYRAFMPGGIQSGAVSAPTRAWLPRREPRAYQK